MRKWENLLFIVCHITIYIIFRLFVWGFPSGSLPFNTPTHLCIWPGLFLLHSLTTSSSISPLITMLNHSLRHFVQLLSELLLFIDHVGVNFSKFYTWALLNTWEKGHFWLKTCAAKHEVWKVRWMSSQRMLSAWRLLWICKGCFSATVHLLWGGILLGWHLKTHTKTGLFWLQTNALRWHLRDTKDVLPVDWIWLKLMVAL